MSSKFIFLHTSRGSRTSVRTAITAYDKEDFLTLLSDPDQVKALGGRWKYSKSGELAVTLTSMTPVQYKECFEDIVIKDESLCVFSKVVAKRFATVKKSGTGIITKKHLTVGHVYLLQNRPYVYYGKVNINYSVTAVKHSTNKYGFEYQEKVLEFHTVQGYLALPYRLNSEFSAASSLSNFSVITNFGFRNIESYVTAEPRRFKQGPAKIIDVPLTLNLQGTEKTTADIEFYL